MTVAARVYYMAAELENRNFGGTVNQGFWGLTAPGDRQIIIHGFSVTSAQGATAAENIRLRLATYSTALTGTGATEVKANGDNSLASETAALYTVTAVGTLDRHICSWVWSQQGELLYLPTPEMRPVVAAGGRIALECLSTINATTGRAWSGWVCWEEV